MKGENLIIIDPRKTELTKYVDVHLQLRPGANIPLFNALAHAIIEEGLADEEFFKERVSEFEEFRSFVADYSPEKASEICGVRAELLTSESKRKAYSGIVPTKIIRARSFLNLFCCVPI